MDQKTQTATMSADEAHNLLGGNQVISRATFYTAISKGQIPHLRLGKRILIPRQAFMRWLEQAGRTSERDPALDARA